MIFGEGPHVEFMVASVATEHVQLGSEALEVGGGRGGLQEEVAILDDIWIDGGHHDGDGDQGEGRVQVMHRWVTEEVEEQTAGQEERGRGQRAEQEQQEMPEWSLLGGLGQTETWEEKEIGAVRTEQQTT